jgi:glycosyltransferase involved in cell wall biosynthesis
MSQLLLTILTPTYNRKYLISRLYKSLVTQECPMDLFEWLVVDDGSTDETFDFLASLKEIASFRMRVLTKKNGGKHRAVNYAVDAIKAPWTLIIDSDDWMIENGMSKALELIKTYHFDKSVLAIIATGQISNCRPLNYTSSSNTLNYAQFKSLPIRIDSSIIMRTQCLRDHPFPEFKDESFVAEGSCYARCFADGGILLSDQSIIGCEYQVDGLSSKSLSLRISNPLGAVFTYGAELASGVNGKERLKTLINQYRFYFHCNSQKKKVLNSLLYPAHPLLQLLSFLFFLLDKVRKLSDNLGKGLMQF